MQTMTAKNIYRTTDLGRGWFATEWDDGSMTFRNPPKGQRIDLPKASVETLRSIIAEVQSKNSAA